MFLRIRVKFKISPLSNFPSFSERNEKLKNGSGRKVRSVGYRNKKKYKSNETTRKKQFKMFLTGGVLLLKSINRMQKTHTLHTTNCYLIPTSRATHSTSILPICSSFSYNTPEPHTCPIRKRLLLFHFSFTSDFGPYKYCLAKD